MKSAISGMYSNAFCGLSSHMTLPDTLPEKKETTGINKIFIYD